MIRTPELLRAAAMLGTVILASCTATPEAPQAATSSKSPAAVVDDAQFQRDRQSILAMAGNYDVSFDFTETVSFVEGYDLKEPKRSGGHETVIVVEDRVDFISLQHLLVVGPDEAPFVVKHWRQDWQYEPARVLTFIGGNAWVWRDVPSEDREGAWSQTVYQVDDAPRYGAVAEWTYEDGLAAWSAPREWRPLPRRDMTTRDDYHAVDAVNRHVLTPTGWVHEQDNSKLVLRGEPQVLVRESGLNTYRRFDDYPVAAAEDYWAGTADFWEGVRAEWSRIASENTEFAITLKGETEDLYMPLLELAGQVQAGEMALDPALQEARSVIGKYVTADIGDLQDRLRETGADSVSAN